MDDLILELKKRAPMRVARAVGSALKETLSEMQRESSNFHQSVSRLEEGPWSLSERARDAPAKATKQRFAKMCEEAELEIKGQESEYRRCALHNTFHSLAGVLIAIVVGSTLFGSLLSGAVPATMAWIAASLVLLSAVCTGTNAVCKFAERQAKHEAATQRLSSFMISCQMMVARYEDGALSEREFDTLASQHGIQLQLLREQLPRLRTSRAWMHRN